MAMMLYPSRQSDGRWLVAEAAPTGAPHDDKVCSTHASQREALNACGRSWFTISRSGFVIEENRVGELRTETTIHACSSGGEAHRLKARLVAAGLVYIEGAVA